MLGRPQTHPKNLMHNSVKSLMRKANFLNLSKLSCATFSSLSKLSQNSQVSRTGLVVPLAQQEVVQLLVHRNCAHDTALWGHVAQAAAPPQKGAGHQAPQISPSLRASCTQNFGLSPRLYHQNLSTKWHTNIYRNAAIDIFRTLTTHAADESTSAAVNMATCTPTIGCEVIHSTHRKN